LGGRFIGSVYCSWVLKNGCGLSLGAAIPLGVGVGALFALLTEAWAYRPLRNKRSSTLFAMLASLGIYIVVQNFISLLFGDSTKSLRLGPVQAGIRILGGRITKAQVLCVVGSLCVIGGLILLQALTRAGKVLRAIANDATLAIIVGITADKWKLIAHALAGGLAGLSGIFMAMNVDVSPTLGMGAFLAATVAVVIGGFGSIPGVALGAALIAFANQFGVWKLSTQWQGCATFIILLAFMILRPQGFSGRPIGKVAV